MKRTLSVKCNLPTFYSRLSHGCDHSVCLKCFNNMFFSRAQVNFGIQIPREMQQQAYIQVVNQNLYNPVAPGAARIPVPNCGDINGVAVSVKSIVYHSSFIAQRQTDC